MTQRIRRVRAGAALPTDPAKTAKAKRLLKSISNLENEIGELNASLKGIVEELEVLMKESHLSRVAEGDAVAEFVRPAGKAQNIIDARKFYAKVDEDDFFSAISVLVTKAKEILGQKELDKITTTIPGKTGEEKLKITYKK